MTIQKTSHTRFEIWYHVAWATKYRKKVFTHPYGQKAVAQLLRKIAEGYDMKIGEIQVLSDHLHLTLSAPPRIAPSRAVQILKSISTRALFSYYPWLKYKYWGGEVWVAGYFIRTIGPGLTKEEIDRYIIEQSEEV